MAIHLLKFYKSKELNNKKVEQKLEYKKTSKRGSKLL